MITAANANALHIPLADQSVQCVITSPPYWGLRDYGTAKWEGGSAECDHKQTVARHDAGRVNINGFHGSAADDSDKGSINYRDICPRCGARRIDAQIGLEATPAEYVAHIVAVMRECWRVLRDDGVLWLNLGDSYARNGGTDKEVSKTARVGSTQNTLNQMSNRNQSAPDGLKPKDLCGIPWRVAFALQADGWYLRSDIIWNKPNPMPESVTDRPTKAHEYIFLLTKQARYYYDAEAIKEQNTDDMIRRAAAGHTRGPNGKTDSSRNDADTLRGDDAKVITANGRNRRSVWTVATSPYSGAHFATWPPKLIEPMILAGTSPQACEHCGAPWERVVERIAVDDPAGYNGSKFNKGKTNEAHPNTGNGQRHESSTIGWLPSCSHYGYDIPQLPDLPDDVTPPNLCDKCGGSGITVFDDLFGRQEQPCRYCHGTGGDHATPEWIEYQAELDAVQAQRKKLLSKINKHAVTVPQIILDPFAGSGTTGAVAVKHGRRAVLLDLNTKYIDLQFERTNGVQMVMSV